MAVCEYQTQNGVEGIKLHHDVLLLSSNIISTSQLFYQYWLEIATVLYCEIISFEIQAFLRPCLDWFT